jgi:hypothetical protein
MKKSPKIFAKIDSPNIATSKYTISPRINPTDRIDPRIKPLERLVDMIAITPGPGVITKMNVAAINARDEYKVI